MSKHLAIAAGAVALLYASIERLDGQAAYSTGQTIAASFDGWENNSDGTFNLVFGYFNRNWDEEFDIPIGADNNVEPGGPDQGQPTHFYPRRNRYAFRIKVPKDFGAKEIVWTIVSHGKTERAYGSLRPEYITDPGLQQFDVGDFGHDGRNRNNKAPVVRVESDLRRTARVGEPITLTASASDDGIPKVRPAPKGNPFIPPGRHPAFGLQVTWYVFRGPAKAVIFDPEQPKTYPDYRPNTNSPWTPGWTPPPLPADGKFPVRVTFQSPGTYVIRVMAHDGGLQDVQDVTVIVTGDRPASAF